MLRSEIHDPPVLEQGERVGQDEERVGPRARKLAPTECSISPRLRVKASCGSSSIFWSWKTSTACISIPVWMAATSSTTASPPRARWRSQVVRSVGNISTLQRPRGPAAL